MNLTVSSVREAWDLWSVRLCAIYSAVVTAWIALDDDSKAKILSLAPAGLADKGPAIVVLLGFIGTVIVRLIPQPGLRK